MNQYAKFCADRSNRCQDMDVCLYFKMAAVRHLRWRTAAILDFLSSKF